MPVSGVQADQEGRVLSLRPGAGRRTLGACGHAGVRPRSAGAGGSVHARHVLPSARSPSLSALNEGEWGGERRWRSLGSVAVDVVQHSTGSGRGRRRVAAMVA